MVILEDFHYLKVVEDFKPKGYSEEDAKKLASEESMS